MKVSVEDHSDAIVIKLQGEMMLGYEANDFHEAILKALEKNEKKIIVDLSNVHFISSWGIGILIYAYTTATSAGGKFKLAAVPEDINEVLRKIKLDKVFEKYATVDEALKS